MEQKQIFVDNNPTTYYIDIEGKCYNTKTKKYLQGSIKRGYRVYEIRYNNKKYEYLAHRLVALYFLPRNEGKDVVNHKDGNKLNNCLNNLEWVTMQENNIHAYETGLKQKTNGCNERIKYTEDLPDEIWKNYHHSDFMISNKGRARNIKTGNLMKGKVRPDGYVEWHIQADGKRKSVVAHRLVYELFGNETLQKNLVINHIDGNKTNNCIDNLEQIAQAENINHGYYVIKTNPLRKVGKYNLDGELLEEYESCADAARKNPGSYPNLISNVCNNKKNSHFGYKWKYINK